MSYGSKSKQSGLFSGRTVLIAIVVATSALSFTLGYFVGGTGGREKQPQSLIVDPQQSPVVQTEQNATPLPQELTTQTVEQPAVGTPKPQAKEEKPLPEKSAAQPMPAKEEISSPPVKEIGPAQNAAEKKGGVKAAIYTVQAGAFKNLKEAEALKHRLEKKGYKSVIKKSGAKDAKLFKVRTGEFTDREKADAVASKLKKDGLKAFVTPKNDDGHEADKNQSRAKQENIR